MSPKTNTLWCLAQFTCIAICFILPTILFWWQYIVSGEDIVQLDGAISDIDTSFLDDCDPFSKNKYKLIFHYNYTYMNKTYDGEYEICETNDGTETQLEIHPIGSRIVTYIKPDNPVDSTVDSAELMNQYFLGFAITFTIISVLILSFFTCCFETLTEEIKKFLIGKASEAADHAI